MGKIDRPLLIVGMFVLGLVGVFIGPRALDEVRAGKECDTLREVFKMDKNVLVVF